MLDLLAGTIRTATPILLAALGGLICERVGVFNIALEGLMLFGAFFGIWGVWLVGSPWAGAGIAIVLTSILAFIFAVLVVKFHSDPTITALGINMLAEGVTTFSMKLVFGDQGSIHSSQIVGLPKIDLPLIDNIPILGDILSGYTPMVYLSWILVALCAFFLYRTSAGVNLRMVGENPRAAATAGIPVERYQILVVTISGIFCALAGTHLSMGYVTMFTENMTSGRGFIAYTAVVFGKADPVMVLVASLVFGAAESLSYRAQQFGSIPSPIIMMMPYLITIVALLLRRERRRKAAVQA
ncbi:MAG: ABC transporter permease [Oscillospiraceae bacterium]|nr:ABC transporter permease [Oscillospiraceae bacterium]